MASRKMASSSSPPSSLYHPVYHNRTIQGKESTRQWRILMNMCSSTSTSTSESLPIHHRHRKRKREQDQQAAARGEVKPFSMAKRGKYEEVEDPFDCSGCIVPATHELVEDVLKDGIQRWNELDSRKIDKSCDDDDEYAEYGDNHDDDDDDDDGDAIVNSNDDDHDKEKEEEENYRETTQRGKRGPGRLNRRWGYFANRLRLPEGFDYTCTNRPPSPSLSSNKKRSRVISLENPLQTQDYEEQLWHIFDSIPSEQDIEKQALKEEKEKGICRNAINMKHEIDIAQREYTRLDAHSLSRMRMKDRHQLPTLRRHAPSAPNSSSYKINGTRMKIECRRRQPKRASSLDPHRLELEFHGEQTLWDLHCTIVECGHDDLFELANKKGSQDDGGKECHVSSGLFFIADTFYITGENEVASGDNGGIDYVTHIMKWLDEPIPIQKQHQNYEIDEKDKTTATSPTKENDNKTSIPKQTIRFPRREYLNIPTGIPLKIKSMKETTLRSLDIKLGVRYCHVYNGDCECALFFTDISSSIKDDDLSKEHYPLVHDIWTYSNAFYNNMECKACEFRPAIVMVVNDEMVEGDGCCPTELCYTCFSDLHYESNDDGGGGKKKLRYNNFQVYPLDYVCSEVDRSAGYDADDALF